MKTRHFKLTLAYDGTQYGGWQLQPNTVTIQQVMETALARIVGRPVRVHGSGRTDAGVHARAQVASCALATDHASSILLRALNAQLPADIRVTRVQEVGETFHARFSATGKEYRYQIDCGAVADPFLRTQAWHHPRPLNVAAMRRAARWVKGRHDFTALSAKSARNPVRRITKLTITRRGNRLTIAVAADGFLYKMVRSVVGALVRVGEDRLAEEQLRSLLAGRQRHALVETAPAKGLTLWSVRYRAKPRSRFSGVHRGRSCGILRIDDSTRHPQ